MQHHARRSRDACGPLATNTTNGPFLPSGNCVVIDFRLYWGRECHCGSGAVWHRIEKMEGQA